MVSVECKPTTGVWGVGQNPQFGGKAPGQGVRWQNPCN